ncbi:MAG: hypothetical protein OEM96_09175, partial [Gemmatimonadota bacterium]|nr:hypothetical protein [Gemmatimonadota bacterium]
MTTLRGKSVGVSNPSSSDPVVSRKERGFLSERLAHFAAVVAAVLLALAARSSGLDAQIVVEDDLGRRV